MDTQNMKQAYENEQALCENIPGVDIKVLKYTSLWRSVDKLSREDKASAFLPSFPVK